jgi:integrase
VDALRLDRTIDGCTAPYKGFFGKRWSAHPNRRRAAAVGIATKFGNHSFRATGTAAYLKHGGTLEKAAAMANHASTRTTQLCDRRRDEPTLDEVERIVI